MKSRLNNLGFAVSTWLLFVGISFVAFLVSRLIPEPYEAYRLLLQSAISLVLSLFVWKAIRKNYVRQEPRPVSRSMVFSICILMISLHIFGAAVADLLEVSVENNVDHEAISSGGDALAMVIMIGMLTPINEEIFMRGFLLSELCLWMKPKLALVVHALIFGALHGLGVNGVVSAIAGWFYGVFYLSTRRLRLPIIAHFAANFLQLVVMVVAAGIAELLGFTLQPPMLLLASLAGLICVLGYRRGSFQELLHQAMDSSL